MKPRCSSLFIPFLLFSLLLNSQSVNYLQAYKTAEKYYYAPNASSITDSQAIHYYQQAIASLTKENIFNVVLIDAYLKSGILYMTDSRNAPALTNFNAAINACQVSPSLPDSLLFQPYLYAGSIQYSLNKLDTALLYYKKAEAISIHHPALNELERLYNKLGVLYYETGDYRRSIPYYEKALSLAASKKSTDISLLVTYKNNIASSYLKMGDYTAALSIYKNLLPYHYNEDQLYTNISTVYLQQDKPDTALLFLQAIKENSIVKYNNLARAFINKKQFDSAAFYNAKAQEVFKRKPDNTKLTDYGLMLKYAGDIDDARAQFSSALKNYQQALVSVVPGFHDTVVMHNPVVFSGMPNFSLVFDLLFAKGNAFKKLHSADTTQHQLQHALDAYSAALTLARQVERSYSSDDARLFLKDRLNVVSAETAILFLRLHDLAKDPGYIAGAFRCVENNKASVLQTGIQQLELSAVAGLPAALINKEKGYRAILAKMNLQAATVKDSALAVLLEKKIRDTSLQLSLVQQQLDEDPAYHRLKFADNSVHPESIRKLLSGKSEVVLSYYYIGQQLFCFYINAEQIGYTSTRLPNDFFSDIKSLRTAMETPGVSGMQAENDIMLRLYHSLLSPVEKMIKGKKHLVIIPYNEISYIPFELLKNPANNLSLVRTFAISYQYAANFLFDKQVAAGTTYKVLAMAPFTEKNNRSDLPSIPSSAAEINGLEGEIVKDEAATKSRFINLAGSFPIIHLATHAIANDKDPLGTYIEFYTAKGDLDSLHRLYEKEIYNLDMKAARLLILSACETGNGALVNGEGVISLSRAFSYAGCKSVITSLWKADDIATAFIMKRLHVYLKKGFSKDEALQKAKLDYLDNPDIEDRYKTPSYWAHLILIGNHEPVVLQAVAWHLPVLVILLLMLLAFGWYKTKRAQ